MFGILGQRYSCSTHIPQTSEPVTSPHPAGYITTILEDARVYSEHAQKKELDVADVRLAIQNRMDHSFTVPPPRDVSTGIYCTIVILWISV